MQFGPYGYKRLPNPAQ